MDLANQIEWNIIKFMTHPTADIIKQRLKDHKVSMDREKPFYKFHFINLEYDYDFLKAEFESENWQYFQYGHLL